MVYKVKPFSEVRKKELLHYSYHYLSLPGPGGVHMQLHAGLTFLQLRIVYNQDLHKCQGVTAAISGASSKANSLSTILGMPPGPGAFLTFVCRRAM